MLNVAESVGNIKMTERKTEMRKCGNITANILIIIVSNNIVSHINSYKSLI